MMEYLSLCCIVKDEEKDYLREWVAYHQAIGVERFYIYDNESREPVKNILSDYVAHNRVIVIEAPGRVMQIPAYAHCLYYFGAEFRWIGFIDGDEFIVPKTTCDLREFLQDYEGYPGLGVNWYIFGTSGHEEKPPGGQIENFTLRTGPQHWQNKHIKSIVQPQYTLFPNDPHQFSYREGRACVNENFAPIDGKFSPHSCQKIQLNHYMLRSHNQFVRKIQRGPADSTRNDARKIEELTDLDRASNIEDRFIQKVFAEAQQQIHLSPVHALTLSADKLRVDIDRFLMVLYHQTIQDVVTQNDYKKLVYLVSIMATCYPNTIKLYGELVDFLHSLNFFELGNLVLKSAYETYSEDEYICRLLAENLYARGMVEEAENILMDLLRRNPKNVSAYESLGVLLLKKNQYKQALACLSQGFQIQPQNQNILRGLQMVLEQLQKTPKTT